MIHDHPTETYIDEDLEAHDAFRAVGDEYALRIIGYVFAAFALGFFVTMACVLRWLS